MHWSICSGLVHLPHLLHRLWHHLSSCWTDSSPDSSISTTHLNSSYIWKALTPYLSTNNLTVYFNLLSFPNDISTTFISHPLNCSICIYYSSADSATAFISLTVSSSTSSDYTSTSTSSPVKSPIFTQLPPTSTLHAQFTPSAFRALHTFHMNNRETKIWRSCIIADRHRRTNPQL